MEINIFNLLLLALDSGFEVRISTTKGICPEIKNLYLTDPSDEFRGISFHYPNLDKCISEAEIFISKIHKSIPPLPAAGTEKEGEK